MTTANVKDVISVKEYNSQNGTVYYHNLIMSNADKINIGKKKKLNIGDLLNYEIVGDKLPNGGYQREYPQAKSVQPQRQFNKGIYDARGVKIGHAVSNAVNLVCAGVEFQGIDFKSNQEQIYKYAQVILKISKRLENEL